MDTVEKKIQIEKYWLKKYKLKNIDYNDGPYGLKK